MRDGRKSTPLELDGVAHECEEFKKSHRSVRSIRREEISPEDIARYESNINKKK